MTEELRRVDLTTSIEIARLAAAGSRRSCAA
jgi:hypothetical protein